MSDLRPAGVPVMVGGEAHSLLFTLNVIDAIQSEFAETTWQILKRFEDEREGPAALRFVLKELLNDEGYRTGKVKIYSEKEIGSMVSIEEIPMLEKAIIAAYSASVPESGDDEEDDPDDEPELLDIAQLIVLATSKMGYTEEEVFKMTTRKFFILLDKYFDQSGRKKKNCGIDDLP